MKFLVKQNEEWVLKKKKNTVAAPLLTFGILL